MVSNSTKSMKCKKTCYNKYKSMVVVLSSHYIYKYILTSSQGRIGDIGSYLESKNIKGTHFSL